MHNNKITRSYIRSHRVIASLNREQVDFLDKIGKDAWFSSGIKLSRTQILSAMVNVLKKLNLSGDGIKDSEQFEQKVLANVAKQKPPKQNGQTH
jgi:hypothetical protein